MGKSGDAKMRFEMALSFLDGEEKDVTQAIKWLDKAFEVAEADEVSDFSNQIMEKPDLDSQFREHFAKNIGETMLSAAKEELDKDEPDYAAAETLLTELAEDGNAEAQYLLARVYRDADDPIHDVAKYAEWIQKAAANGYEEAQKMIEREAKQTDAWAEQGSSQGMCMAALEYASGKTLSGLPHEKDVLKAIELYEKAFEAGDVDGAIGLARLYEEGEGISVDLPKAHEWTLKAAERGDVSAQVYAGIQLLTGRGVCEDKIAAVRWFRKAADQGSKLAMSHVGDGFKYGWGVGVDASQAAAWYEKAIAPKVSDSDDGTECEDEPPTNAFVELAELLLEGKGVEKDAERAVKLLTKAADAGEEKAQFMMGTMYMNPADMGVGSIQQDVGKGVEWIKKSADLGFGMAEWMLAGLYVQGIGVEKDLAKAKECYELALEHGGLTAKMEEDVKLMLAQLKGVVRATDSAEESDAESECPGLDPDANDEEKAEFQEMLSRAKDGNADAQYDLAVACALGRHGAKRDCGRAAAWYKKSADAGKVEAIVGLADCYKDGEVADKGLADAIPLYEKAAQKGDWRAQHVLALDIYSSGEDMPEDYAKAVKWALMAADNDGTQYVFELLGKCYEKGLGTDKNVALAMKYYQMAIKEGSAEAQVALTRLSELSGDCLYDKVKFGPGVSDSDKVACRKVYDEAVEGRPGAEYEMGNVLSLGMYGIVVNIKEAFSWYLKSAEHGFMDAQAVVASYYSSGVKDVVDWNDAEKFKWYWEAAMQGHVESMRKVADCFFYGSGVSENNEEAKWWYIRAAKAGDEEAIDMLETHWKMDEDDLHGAYGMISEYPAGMKRNAADSDKELFRKLLKQAKSGDADAQFRLGHAFVFGEDGAEENERHGVLWLKRSAQQGNADAENLLGYCCNHGFGIEENETLALRYYRKAAEKGHAEAAETIGRIYRRGICGVEEDRKEAFKWYMIGAKAGRDESQFQIGFAYYFGKGVDEDESEAFEWFEKAAQQGHAEAQCRYAECFLLGNGVEKDLEKAREWYTKSAEQGEALAQFNLGKIYYFGKGVEKDYGKAVKWFLKAADDGSADAQFLLGECYDNGHGVEEDAEEAFKWYLKSAQQGNKEAQYSVGVDYYIGEGVEEDDVKAFEWYMKAAVQGHVVAQYDVGRCYEGAGGVDMDIDEAKRWYKKASDNGNEDAKAALERLGD